MTIVSERPLGLSVEELDATLDVIETVQLESGMVPWFFGGHCDPWNHVESAMALVAGGRFDQARNAYEWLACTQRIDGSWHAYYRSDGSVKEERMDTNATAYVATGVYHYLVSTGDQARTAQWFPTVDKALTFVLSCQRPGGEVVWSSYPNGRQGEYALLAACSSIVLSLRLGELLAQSLGRRRPKWREAADLLTEAIVERPEAFRPKSEFAMDWYYPVLGGVLGGEDALRRLSDGRATFYLDAYGILCRSDRRWVTTVETAECAMAFARVGCFEEAHGLLQLTNGARDTTGAYATGLVRPDGNEFPVGERTTYSCAAVVLASDVLRGGGSKVVFAPN